MNLEPYSRFNVELSKKQWLISKEKKICVNILNINYE